jgi:hypothetical protein
MLHRALGYFTVKFFQLLFNIIAFGLLGELAARAVLCDEVEKGPLQHALNKESSLGGSLSGVKVFRYPHRIRKFIE